MSGRSIHTAISCLLFDHLCHVITLLSGRAGRVGPLGHVQRDCSLVLLLWNHDFLLEFPYYIECLVSASPDVLAYQCRQHHRPSGSAVRKPFDSSSGQSAREPLCDLEQRHSGRVGCASKCSDRLPYREPLIISLLSFKLSLQGAGTA